MPLSILITGANGFLGSCLVRRLVEPEDVWVYGVYRQGKERLLKGSAGNLQYLQADLSKEDEAKRLFENKEFDVVIHAAALIQAKADSSLSREMANHNIMSQVNLIGAAVQGGCKRFIYCSTISLYGGESHRSQGFRESDCPMPESLYGWSKYAAEELLRIRTEVSTGMVGISLRLSGIHGFGRRSGVVYRMIRAAVAGKGIIVEEPRSRFRLLFVDDAIQAVCLVVFGDIKSSYTCFNVAGKEVFSLEDLAERVKTLARSKSVIRVNDNRRVKDQVLDISKIEKEIGFRPKSLDDNLTKFLKAI